MHFVYIIYSLSAHKYYKGYSTNPFKRVSQHNLGLSRYTKAFCPWILVFIQSFKDKKSALIREKALKKYSHAQIQELINSYLNEL